MSYTLIMKYAFFFLLVILTASCSAQKVAERQTAENQTPKTESPTRQAVLIELFTSEG